MNDVIFNYEEAAVRKNVPQSVLDKIVDEACMEFPFDEMMKELHIVRAINSYAARTKRAVS